MSINPTKSANVVLLAHSRVIHPDSIKGIELDVSGDFQLSINMFHGYVEDAADTNPGFFRIVTSNRTSGDDSWCELQRFPVKGTDPDKVNINATEAAGQTDITVDAVTGLAAGDLVYLQDTNGGSPSGSTGGLSSPETLSEWHLLRKAVSTTATILDGLTNAKDSSDDLWNDASHFSVALDVSAISRVRVDFIHEGATGANSDIMVVGERLTELATA